MTFLRWLRNVGTTGPNKHVKQEENHSINKQHQPADNELLQCIVHAVMMVAEENHKAPTRQRTPIHVEHWTPTYSWTSGSAVKFMQGKLLNCFYSFLQEHKDPLRRKEFAPPLDHTVLSPQVTFLCSLSLETITLPWSPDAHQHTEQMICQSLEMGGVQSDTSQVRLCGYGPLPPLRPELCEVSLRTPLRAERAGSFSWTMGGNWEQHHCIK